MTRKRDALEQSLRASEMIRRQREREVDELHRDVRQLDYAGRMLVVALERLTQREHLETCAFYQAQIQCGEWHDEAYAREIGYRGKVCAKTHEFCSWGHVEALQVLASVPVRWRKEWQIDRRAGSEPEARR